MTGKGVNDGEGREWRRKGGEGCGVLFATRFVSLRWIPAYAGMTGKGGNDGGREGMTGKGGNDGEKAAMTLEALRINAVNLV